MKPIGERASYYKEGGKLRIRKRGVSRECQLMQRLLTIAEILKLYPDAGLKGDSVYQNWCKDYYYRESAPYYCVRPKGHEGPHVDTRIDDEQFLIW